MASLFHLIGISLILTAPLLGAGFQLSERSASGLGRAYSGEAAIADDASALGWNPASIIILDDWSYTIGSSLIVPKVGAQGTGLTGPISERSVVDDTLVPFAYLTRKINSRLAAGLGIYASHGSLTDYSPDFAAGSITELTELRNANFSPALALRLNQNWTLGASLNITYAEGEISSLTPGSGAPLFNLTGDDWATGYQFGILYQPTSHTRFGLSYRSPIKLDLQGKATLGTSFAPLTGKQPASLPLDLPDTLQLSAYHELTDRWAIHADILWTNWSRFKNLTPQINPLIDPSLSRPQNWNDTLRLSFGTTYQLNDHFTARVGIAWDQSPVDTSNRTLRIPDDDRLSLSTGLSYQITPATRLDLGYSYLIENKGTLRTLANGGNSDAFTGKVGGPFHTLSLGFSGSF